MRAHLEGCPACAEDFPACAISSPARADAQIRGQPSPSSSSSVPPLSTDRGCSATTSEPGRASSSRRLISSHCGFSPGRVRCRAKPPRSFSPWRTKTAWPRSSASGQGDPAALLVVAAVPDDHAALVGRALEAVVGDRVVLDLDREALDRWVHRGALGDRPGAHRSVDLEAQVEVVGGGGVLLDDEGAGADAADRELLVALDLDALDLDLGDPRGRRAVARGRRPAPRRPGRGPRRGRARRRPPRCAPSPSRRAGAPRSRVASRKPTPCTVAADDGAATHSRLSRLLASHSSSLPVSSVSS